MKIDLKRVEREGYDAGLGGKGLLANEYNAQTDAYDTWKRGHARVRSRALLWGGDDAACTETKVGEWPLAAKKTIIAMIHEAE